MVCAGSELATVIHTFKLLVRYERSPLESLISPKKRQTRAIVAHERDNVDWRITQPVECPYIDTDRVVETSKGMVIITSPHLVGGVVPSFEKGFISSYRPETGTPSFTCKIFPVPSTERLCFEPDQQIDLVSIATTWHVVPLLHPHSKS